MKNQLAILSTSCLLAANAVLLAPVTAQDAPLAAVQHRVSYSYDLTSKSNLARAAAPKIDRTPHSRYQNAISRDNILIAEGERLEKISPDSKLAGKFFDRKNYQQAIHYYSRAIAAYPRASFLYLMRGHSSAQMGQYESAMSDANMALAIRPIFSLALYNRGYYHYMLGDKTAAAADAVSSMSLFKKEGDTGMYNTAASLVKLCYQ